MLDPKTLLPGQEQSEEFYASANKKTYVQYDYRAENGKLFSCIKSTLEKCQAARDEWLLKNKD